MSPPLSYPVPWREVFALGPAIARRERHSVDRFSAAVTARMDPAPRLEGLDLLPSNPRFVLSANHYQRRGLWILHVAAAITQAIRLRYGPGDPPVRWIVTANWPPLRLGPWRLPNPGDWLLPRVAHALHCYPVSFSGANPGFTASTLRRLLREAPRLDRPLGIFPEGVAGTADKPAPPLPGAVRLLAHLERLGLPVVRAQLGEAEGRLVIRFLAT